MIKNRNALCVLRFLFLYLVKVEFEPHKITENAKPHIGEAERQRVRKHHFSLSYFYLMLLFMKFLENDGPTSCQHHKCPVSKPFEKLG